MFGLFKKKEPPASSNATKIVAISAKLTALQIALAHVSADRLATDTWSLGYIFGIHDAILQRSGISNQAACLAAITIGFHQVFGDINIAASAVRKCLDLQQDQMFVAGMTVGGNDLYTFLQDQTSPPMALFDHIKDFNDR